LPDRLHSASVSAIGSDDFDLSDEWTDSVGLMASIRGKGLTREGGTAVYQKQRVIVLREQARPHRKAL